MIIPGLRCWCTWSPLIHNFVRWRRREWPAGARCRPLGSSAPPPVRRVTMGGWPVSRVRRSRPRWWCGYGGLRDSNLLDLKTLFLDGFCSLYLIWQFIAKHRLVSFRVLDNVQKSFVQAGCQELYTTLSGRRMKVT